MKKTIAVITAIGALSGGLFGQLDLTDPLETTGTNTSFARLNAAMHNDRTKLNQPGLVAQPMTPLYSEFVFEYNLDINILPEVSSGQFSMNTLTPTGGFDAALRFKLVDEYAPDALLQQFRVFGDAAENLDLDVGYFHSDASGRNTFGVTQDYGNMDLELFNYHKFIAETPPPDIPPKSFKLTGTGASDDVSFYATTTYAPGDPPDPRPFGPHFQDDADYWRVFQLVDQDGVHIDLDGNPVVGTPIARTLYILALEDQGIHPGSNFDFNDGFFLIEGFVTPVPEPSLIGLGGIAALLGFIAYRRRKNKAA